MDNFFWVGGRLWLDAVNSGNGERADAQGTRLELWPDAAALREWARGASERHEEAGVLRDFSHTDDQLLSDMKGLRATLRRVCETAHASGEVAPDAAQQINAALRHRGVVSQLEAGENGWREREVPSGEASDALWLVARSVARSLSRGELARLRPCASPSCVLWFLDTSKNGTRRWCSMEGCGNRAKVSAHFARRKAQ